MPAGEGGAGAPQISASGPISAAATRTVLDLVSAAAEEDGVGPLSEHVLLHLRHGGDARARNLLLTSDGALAGYAHCDPTDPVAGPSAELVIHPAYRRRGFGLLLVRALITEAAGRPLRLWAHGDLPAATRLAAVAGFDRVRDLWQMRCWLHGPPPAPRLPADVTIRTFVVGQDEDEWVKLNSRAFAGHPEQGMWTRSDIELREREPWFDPGGFFLADRAGEMIGFHWTKVHGNRGGHAHEPIGEVYIVGVDPVEQGTGLGRALTLVGLRHLRSRGLRQVLLYVDGANAPAIALYQSLGFTKAGTDVMFGLTPPG